MGEVLDVMGSCLGYMMQTVVLAKHVRGCKGPSYTALSAVCVSFCGVPGSVIEHDLCG